MFLWLEEIWAMPRNLIYFKGASLVTSKCKMIPEQAPSFVLLVVQAPSTVGVSCSQNLFGVTTEEALLINVASPLAFQTSCAQGEKGFTIMNFRNEGHCGIVYSRVERKCCKTGQGFP